MSKNKCKITLLLTCLSFCTSTSALYAMDEHQKMMEEEAKESSNPRKLQENQRKEFKEIPAVQKGLNRVATDIRRDQHFQARNVEEESRPVSLSFTQKEHLKTLNADGIVEWWGQHMNEFHFNTILSYDKSVNKLSDKYANDQISEATFKKKLLNLLK